MTRARYLPALDGLRALAVLAVIGFHADVPHFGGGFLGVEVFFVVSGYLITRLLLLERDETGHISLPSFWARRARRLLPALFAVLLAALGLSLAVAPDALAQTRSDAGAALFYVSNWWQIIQHRSYFMDVDRPPLLLHLWSLAVEEQFYLVWPLAVALLGRAAPRWVLPGALLGFGRTCTILGSTRRACTLGATRAFPGSCWVQRSAACGVRRQARYARCCAWRAKGAPGLGSARSPGWSCEATRIARFGIAAASRSSTSPAAR
jgi:peptidoglycan/LPS O-acetylase OafA/YrhL